MTVNSGAYMDGIVVFSGGTLHICSGGSASYTSSAGAIIINDNNSSNS